MRDKTFFSTEVSGGQRLGLYLTSGTVRAVDVKQGLIRQSHPQAK